MVTNNAVNIKNSGIVNYDGAGTFSALSNPLTVSNGGQGNPSLVAFAPLCGGTTSTSALQSIASLGNPGDWLTSSGAGALPTMSRGNLGYIFTVQTASGNPADNITYFLQSAQALTTTTTATVTQRFVIPMTGRLVAAYGLVTVAGTLGSSENVTMGISLNGNTPTVIVSNLQLTSSSQTFSNSAMSLAVTAGDYILFTFAGPAWVTNPTTVIVSVSARFI